MKTTIKTLLGSIKKMPNKDCGICGQPVVVCLSLEAYNIVRALMVKWPKFSGACSYPVPSTIEGCDPRECFHNKLKDLWNKEDEYGALRWELLDWLIEQPETDVELYRMQRDGAKIVFNIKD